MGGLGPGIGGAEYIVIAIVALLVVGPERLPMLLRKVGKMVAKARNMANEFRASFDEMARQSELDDLRKEVEALRTHQGVHALGADAEAAFKSINADLNGTSTARPPIETTEPEMLAAPDEWPDTPPVMEPVSISAPTETPILKPQSPRKKTSGGKKTARAASSPAKPRAPRKKAVDQ